MDITESLSVRTVAGELIEDLLNESTVKGNPWSDHVRFREFSPSVNVRETPGAVVIFAELPGIEEPDIDISINRGYIILRGEKRLNEEEGPDDFGHFERVYGRFSRLIRLPENADESRVSATLNRGILKIRVERTGVIGADRH